MRASSKPGAIHDIDRLLTLVTLILTHLAPGQATEATTDAQGGDQAK